MIQKLLKRWCLVGWSSLFMMVQLLDSHDPEWSLFLQQTHSILMIHIFSWLPSDLWFCFIQFLFWSPWLKSTHIIYFHDTQIVEHYFSWHDILSSFRFSDTISHDTNPLSEWFFFPHVPSCIHWWWYFSPRVSFYSYSILGYIAWCYFLLSPVIPTAAPSSLASASTISRKRG